MASPAICSWTFTALHWLTTHILKTAWENVAWKLDFINSEDNYNIINTPTTLDLTKGRDYVGLDAKIHGEPIN